MPLQFQSEDKINTLVKAFENGIIFPKGHGRLIDADELLRNKRKVINDAYGVEGMVGVTFENISKDDIENAPTIMEADKGGN